MSIAIVVYWDDVHNGVAGRGRNGKEGLRRIREARVVPGSKAEGLAVCGEDKGIETSHEQG